MTTTTIATEPETTPDVAAYALLSAALIARIAARLGAPRLAVRAARRAAATAEQLVLLLSADVARTSPAAEAAALEDVRASASLRPFVHPTETETP